MNTLHNQDEEVDRFLEFIFQNYGYDFRNYRRTHILRRIHHRMLLEGFDRVAQLQNKLESSKEALGSILKDFSINVTEMFRDPDFFLAFRQKVIPLLSTYPFIRIWNAGCASGEEVFSLGIILKEENLLERVQIYATDFNKKVLETAAQGIFPLSYIKTFENNYREAGGKSTLSNYYVSAYGSVKFDGSISKRIVFADHNLVTDHVFAEVHLIFCRNVLIYFEPSLQERVIGLFTNSLINGGILCLGTKENLRYSGNENYYSVVDRTFRIFKKRMIV